MTTITGDLTLEQVAEELNVRLERARILRRRHEFPNAYDVAAGSKHEWRIPRSDIAAFKNRRKDRP